MHGALLYHYLASALLPPGTSPTPDLQRGFCATLVEGGYCPLPATRPFRCCEFHYHLFTRRSNGPA